MSMTKKEIDGAIEEARRFISRAEAAIAAEHPKLHYMKTGAGDDDWEYVRGYPDGVVPDNAIIGYTKEAGALKRASLDLTRTLADLRRS